MSTTTTLTTDANSKGRDMDPLQAADSSAEKSSTNSAGVLEKERDEIRPSQWFKYLVHEGGRHIHECGADELFLLVETGSFWDEESTILDGSTYALVLGLSDDEARQRLAYRLAKNGASPNVVAVAISSWGTGQSFQDDFLDLNSLHRRYCDRVVIQAFHQLYFEDERFGNLRRPLTSGDESRLSTLLNDELSGKGPARYWR